MNRGVAIQKYIYKNKALCDQKNVKNRGQFSNPLALALRKDLTGFILLYYVVHGVWYKPFYFAHYYISIVKVIIMRKNARKVELSTDKLDLLESILR